MKILLDTHAFLWAITNNAQLSVRVTQEIVNPDNEVFSECRFVLGNLSIKYSLGKLHLPQTPDRSFWPPGRG